MRSFFDAGGRRYLVDNETQNIQTFDGDGQRIKQTEDNGSPNHLKRRYYVNSSVLGAVYEIVNTGASTVWVKTGTVSLNGQKIAIQRGGLHVWRIYENSATGAMRGSVSMVESEPDPMGINNGLYAPPQQNGGGGEVPDFILPHRIVDPTNFTSGCQWGGLPISCGSLDEINEAEQRIFAAYQANNPDNPDKPHNPLMPRLGQPSGVTFGHSWSLDNMFGRAGRFGSPLDSRSADATGNGFSVQVVPGSNFAPPPEGQERDPNTTYATRDQYVLSYSGTRQTRADLPKVVRDFYTNSKKKEKFNECINFVFNKLANGTVINTAFAMPLQTLKNAPMFNVLLTQFQLQGHTQKDHTQGTFDTEGSYGTVYIASDVYLGTDTRSPLSDDEVARTFFHELGNILSARYAKGDARFYGDPNGIGNVKDKDTGARFELCLFGSVPF